MVTNCDGVRELFDAEFPTWNDEASLRRSVSSSPAIRRRRELVDRYRARVLEQHTYARRAEQLRDLLIDWCETRRISLAVGVPRREEADFWRLPLRPIPAA